jgi:hypothetical protein
VGVSGCKMMRQWMDNLVKTKAKEMIRGGSGSE